VAQQALLQFLQRRQHPRADRQTPQPGDLVELLCGMSRGNHREHKPRKTLHPTPSSEPSSPHIQRPFAPSRCFFLGCSGSHFKLHLLSELLVGPRMCRTDARYIYIYIHAISVCDGSYMYFITLLCIDSCCHSRSSQQLTTLTF